MPQTVFLKRLSQACAVLAFLATPLAAAASEESETSVGDAARGAGCWYNRNSILFADILFAATLFFVDVPELCDLCI